ncbi:hypothetical protein KI614_14470 [Dechloromonas denitrificans]|uniref:hypothetical protein n=1 Tax=Dechloromonas denitrificans TaxID=281362 RepID=UPI001CF8F413|nr:hypothetical protein [Dechloromonas denitrificans]UCV11333.1 hypothetical protein KI614_14470 [Dechloromonas denitrificans]
MIETSTSSIDEFIDASKTRKNPVGKQRHVVDAFRTVAWFNFLKRHCGATSTYQMDQRLEIRPAHGKTRECDYKNKWRSYRKGLHTPSPDLVNAIETIYAGGYAVLNHVLWKTLRRDCLISLHSEFWFGELHPETQKIIYQRESNLGFGKTPHRSLNQTQLAMLERRAGPDALACLVILLRQAVENHDGVFAQTVSRRVCRMLLILGPILSAIGIGTPLVQYFEQELLPLATLDGRHYQYGGSGYQSVARRLSVAANLIEGDENRLFTNEERIALRIALLDGRRGDILDSPICLAPPQTP